MNTVILILFASLISICLSAQNPTNTLEPNIEPLVPDTTWRTSVKFALNFNQAAFSDNWIGGGVNSIAFSSFFNYQAHY